MSLNSYRTRFFLLAGLIVLRPVGAWSAPDDVEAAPVRPQANPFFINDAQFEANLFQPSGDAKQAKILLETRLKLQLDELRRICGLTDEQSQKLKLAASFDVKRFFDEVDAVRRKYQKSKHDQNAWNQIWQEIHPLQLKMATGLFGESSFFGKSIRKTLSEEQLVSYTAFVNERRRYRYRATIEVVLTNIESSMPLSHLQRNAFVKLLDEETPAPASFGQYDQHVVMYNLSTLPESKIRPLLDERQWTQLSTQVKQYREMKPFLILNGVIDDRSQKMTVRDSTVNESSSESALKAQASENRVKEPQ